MPVPNITSLTIRRGRNYFLIAEGLDNARHIILSVVSKAFLLRVIASDKLIFFTIELV